MLRCRSVQKVVGLAKRVVMLVLLFSFSYVPSLNAAVLVSDTTWSKNMTVSEDILIPKGVTLTIKSGTVVRILPAESTKTDPEFISPLTEITVRGRIIIEGTKDAPVEFISAEPGREGEWAGIIVDSGEASIRGCHISSADSAVYISDASVSLSGVLLTGNRYGVTTIGKRSSLTMRDSRVIGNDYGVIIASDVEPMFTDTIVRGNKKKDLWKQDIPNSAEYKNKGGAEGLPQLTRSYSDEVLIGDTVWRGRIRVDGNLRIPEGSRLLITPGTVIEFSKKDTNGDGIGENGILIQGMLVAKGTKEKPIRFRSAELIKNIGDWDSINLMNSDKSENLIENCSFEDAYRGLHFHYSNVKVIGSSFSRSHRGIQFQESAVEIVESEFIGNRSAVQGRDSAVRFVSNRLYDNYQGVNFFRNNLLVSDNHVTGSLREGIRIREGSAIVSKNQITGNRHGIMLADIYYGVVTENLIANSSEAGLSLRNVDNIEVQGNYLGKNGSNGLSLQDVRGELKNNLFAFNSERGIGITSFSGEITGNNFVGNGLYAIDLESADGIDAPGNWWGGDSPEKVIFDRNMDSARGEVRVRQVSTLPALFSWPVREISGNIVLAGDIKISGQTTVPVESFLTISPGTSVKFAEAAGLTVRGRITSQGTSVKPIFFTSLSEKAPGAWDEIAIEQALDSSFSYTVIEYANWGIHGHFTNLILDHVRVQHNGGGMRFRSGPVTVRQSVFAGNGIGIRSYIGNGTFEENIITDNEIGVFVRERGGGLLLKNNNIFGNSDYNVRSGDFNTEDIPATANWWGVQAPERTIYDGRVETGIGRVLFEPALSQPVNLENAGVQ